MEALAKTACYNHATSGASGALFLTLINSLILSQCPKNFIQTTTINDGDEFDFIVVGAGSAGSVVARRLSDNPNWKVLLLEAGGDPPQDSEVPLMFFNVQRTESDWAYFTEASETSCLGMENQQCYWPRGKMLGGCSSMNAMLYVRGNPSDYNHWSDLGHEGWDWDSVMPYFIKSENVQDERYKSSELHGHEGPLYTTHLKSGGKMRELLIESAKEFGIYQPDDSAYLGFYETLQTIHKGRRWSASKAYLSELNRKNLYIASNQEVEHVIMRDGRAVGVNIANSPLNVYARKEVILSAGAINTPQILMHSGIGPQDQLEKLKIPMVADLPVGENLQDHIVTFFTLFSLPNIDDITDPISEYHEYITNHTGPFASTGVTNLIWFLSTKNENYPNLLIHFLQDTKGSPALKLIMNQVGVKKDIQRNILEAVQDNDILIAGVTLLNPKSRGKITLNSDKSINIQANTFADREDIDTLIDGIEHVKQFFSTKMMKDANVKLLEFSLPPCDSNEFDSRSYWECNMRHLVTTLYHPVGTASMGSVLDSELNVLNVNNLRVADGSIMPKIISGNTNVPIIMIGEKAADLIKSKYESS